jgi:hypothetical protein
MQKSEKAATVLIATAAANAHGLKIKMYQIKH